MKEDIFYMKIAYEEAQKAYKKGEIPVGCVIVDEQEFKKELSKLLDDFDNDEPTLVAPVKNATAKKIDLDEIYKNIYRK